jgi:hypothetical protein
LFTVETAQKNGVSIGWTASVGGGQDTGAIVGSGAGEVPAGELGVVVGTVDAVFSEGWLDGLASAVGGELPKISQPTRIATPSSASADTVMPTPAARWC